MKNRKGFTLVELLATIIILGLLSTIAIVNITRVIEKTKTARSRDEKEMLVKATETYLQDNKKYAPERIGETEIISISALKTNNYLKEDLKNSKGESCMENTFVRVHKFSKNEYSYFPVILCGDDREETSDHSPPTPEISIEIDDLDNLKNPSVHFTIKGSPDGTTEIASYEYVILSKSNTIADYTEVGNSGNINGRKKKEITGDIPLKNYINTVNATSIVVRVTAINIYGIRASNDSDADGDDTVYRDTIPPSCVVETVYNAPQGDEPAGSGDDEGDDDDDDDCGEGECEEEVTESISAIYSPPLDGNYIHAPRTVTVGCVDDENGSGCVRKKFTKTFPNEEEDEFGNKIYKYGATTATITIEDNAGNTTECEVTPYVDVTPTCGDVTYNPPLTDASATSRTLTINCDSYEYGPKCSQPTYSKTFTTDTTSNTIEMTDEYGKTISCSVDPHLSEGVERTHRINVTNPTNSKTVSFKPTNGIKDSPISLRSKNPSNMNVSCSWSGNNISCTLSKLGTTKANNNTMCDTLAKLYGFSEGMFYNKKGEKAKKSNDKCWFRSGQSPNDKKWDCKSVNNPKYNDYRHKSWMHHCPDERHPQNSHTYCRTRGNGNLDSSNYTCLTAGREGKHCKCFALSKHNTYYAGSVDVVYQATS